MFVPECDMSSSDWDQLSQDSDGWDPGDKARAVVLGPGDVLVMRAGLVHAVLTLGDLDPCLMTGGSFWDDRDLLHILKTQYWVVKNQKATNELLAYQQAQITSALSRLVIRYPKKYFASSDDLAEFNQIITRLQSFSCSCDDCDDECECSREGRRCTPLCTAHTFNMSDLRSCMIEKGDDGRSDEEQGGPDGDYV